MIDLGESIKESNSKEPASETNLSRITPMSNIEQLNFKRAHSKLVND